MADEDLDPILVAAASPNRLLNIQNLSVLARYSFLAPELVAQVLRVAGFPKLSRAYESSVEGLYFVGAPAAASMGPVSGLRVAHHAAARAISPTMVWFSIPEAETAAK